MALHVAFYSSKPYDEDVFCDFIGSSDYADKLTINFIKHSLDENTATLCKNVHTVCVFVNDDVSENVLSVLAKQGVKHIALRCAGFNNVDIKAAAALGIRVTRVPAYSPETVAEHTLALILTLNRKTHKAYNRIKEGNFELTGLMGFTLKNKTVGVIGTGKIGSATIQILQGFGCNVICCDPYPNPHIEQVGARYVDLATLLTQSHIVTLHCPLTEDSYHLIDDDAINRMPKGVMLINTSRGGLVDGKALIKGLKNKQIGFLGLDVYEQESELFFRDHLDNIIQDDTFQRLQSFPNVLITGHQGFFTREALGEIAHVTVENIIAASTHSLGTSDNVVV